MAPCRLAVLLAVFLVGCAVDPVIPAAAPRKPPPAEMYDLVIRHGTVIDGSGQPAFNADVGIQDGRIAAVGKIDARAGREEIDARGLAVAPGFIDVHTHADEDVHRQPTAENFVRDGVTTIINGNCGGSVADVGRYLARIERDGAAVNVATLYGHNTVLRAVKGDNADRLTRAQLDQAKNLVDKAMRDGAVGMSTGLIYNPGQFSPIEEIIELQRVAARHGGIYATHMRSESGAILSAIDEALAIGKRANCRVQISHFKLTADASKKIAQEVQVGDTLRPAAKLGTDVTLARVEAARAAGQEVWLDQYPYTASSTTINTLIPDPYVKDGIDAARRRLNSDPAERDRLMRMMAEQAQRRGLKSYAYAVIASCPKTPTYNGRNILDIARANKLREAGGGELLKSNGAAAPEVTLEDQFRTIIDIFAGGGAQCIFHSMDEADVENIMKSPIVGVASDSGIRQFGVGVPHPRGYGTNARVLGRYARERKLFSIEEAVRKMTSLPAHAFRLEGRGLIKVGHHADLVLFDPRSVIDTATFEQPHQYPSGIPTVIVNGVPVLLDGQMTGRLPGGAIYGPAKTK